MLTQYLTTACNISFLSTTNEREREREGEREPHTVVVYPRKHSLNVMHWRQISHNWSWGQWEKGQPEFTTPTLVPSSFWNETSYWLCLTWEMFHLKFEDWFFEVVIFLSFFVFCFFLFLGREAWKSVFFSLEHLKNHHYFQYRVWKICAAWKPWFGWNIYNV